MNNIVSLCGHMRYFVIIYAYMLYLFSMNHVRSWISSWMVIASFDICDVFWAPIVDIPWSPVRQSEGLPYSLPSGSQGVSIGLWHNPGEEGRIRCQVLWVVWKLIGIWTYMISKKIMLIVLMFYLWFPRWKYVLYMTSCGISKLFLCYYAN